MLLEIVQFFVIEGLPRLGGGQILLLALQAADVEELVRDEHVLDIGIVGQPHHCGVLALEFAQILPGQFAFSHSTRAEKEEFIVLSPKQPVHLLKLRLPAHKVRVVGQGGASDLPCLWLGAVPHPFRPLDRAVVLLFLKPVGNAGDQGSDPLLLRRLGPIQAVDTPQIVFYIIRHALLVGSEGEETDILFMMEPIKSAVDLIEYMLRAGGVLIHNQQKNFTFINGAHNVPGIFGCYIPGRIPALDSLTLQRLDNVLHKLG